MSNIDDRIIGLDNDNGLLPLDELKHAAEGVSKAYSEILEPSGFRPKVPKPISTTEVKIEEPKTQEESESKILNDKIKDMEAAIKLLVAGRDSVKLKAASAAQKPIDWNKMTERDIFDLSVPIETVGGDLPDYMKITLKDSNFVPRWVQKMPRRLGPMRAKGYTYVTKDEIEGELNIAVEPDENGVIRFDDVILMKIEKRAYYGMLRRNHERALSMVNPKTAHKVAIDRVETELRSAHPISESDQTRSGSYDKYAGTNKMNVYAPGFEL